MIFCGQDTLFLMSSDVHPLVFLILVESTTLVVNFFDDFFFNSKVDNVFPEDLVNFLDIF